MTKETPFDSAVRVEVSDEAVIPGRSGSNERGAWTIPAKQPCYLWQGDRYPIRMELAVPDTGPRKPGFYLLAGKPFKVASVRDRIVINFDDRGVELIPIEAVPGLKVAA